MKLLSFIAFVSLAVVSVMVQAQGGGQPAGRQGGGGGGGGRGQAPIDPPLRNESTMANPYKVVPKWPNLGSIKPGAAIGIIPDNKGGTWLHHRSEPPILHIDGSGNVTKGFANGEYVQAHGFCMDKDGNLWAGDSGPFAENPQTAGKGFVMKKWSQDGKLLLTLGKAGVSKADGVNTFIGPTACAVNAEGNIIIADGHWPRPTSAQQDGDRLVVVTKDGKLVKEVGKLGRGPGDFMGAHSLAIDSQQRVFVADRSNNRVLVLDRNLNYVDQWKQFGRPSGVAVLNDDTLVVSDSESNAYIAGPPQAFEGGGSVVRNPGWQPGVWIGSAKDGSIRYFIPGTRPEGLGADNAGNIFAGLTGGCDTSPSGGCLHKWVRGK
jgi:hypothetical protein